MENIHYLSNAGVMLESGGRKVLIDAFNGPRPEIFQEIPAAVAAKLLRGSPPYDGIDLMLVTHNHGDHFHPGRVVEFCRAFPETPLLSSPEVIAFIRAALPGRRHLFSASPERYGRRAFHLAGIDVSAVSLLHSGRDYTDVTNLAFVLRLGKTFVHTGDAATCEANFQALAAAGATGGVILAPFPFLTLPLAHKHFTERVRPELLYLLHLPRPELDQGGWIKASRVALDKALAAGSHAALIGLNGRVGEVVRLDEAGCASAAEGARPVF